MLGAAITGDNTFFAREDHVEESLANCGTGVETKHTIISMLLTPGDRRKWSA
jgi:hypothetical protein